MTTTKSVMLMTAVLGLAGACGEERVSSELRPGFDSLIGLPFDICTEEGQGAGSLLVRNIGDDTVKIDSVVFAAAAGQEAELSSFDAPEIDKTELLADDEALIRFFYRVPGGVEQNAVLVITSNAAENPELRVDVATQELILEEKPASCND